MQDCGKWTYRRNSRPTDIQQPAVTYEGHGKPVDHSETVPPLRSKSDRPRIFLAVRSNSAFWSADRSDQTESNSTASGRHSSTNKGAGKLGLIN